MKAVATLFLLAILTFGGEAADPAPVLLARIGHESGGEIDGWSLLAAGIAVAMLITARRLP